MKKLSLLLALALIVTMSGVYATWTYALAGATSVEKSLDGETKLAGKSEDNKKGTISVDTSNFSILVDDEGNDHVADMIMTGYIEITFTYNTGATPEVKANGIPMQYTLSVVGLNYGGSPIFEVGSGVVELNSGNAFKTIQIPAADLDIELRSGIELHTVADYNAFYQAIHSGSIMITVSEITA